MKGIVALFAIGGMLLSVQPGLAGGEYRARIDRKWKEVQAQQKKQDAQFNKTQRDVEKALRGVPDTVKAIGTVPSPGIRTCP